MAWFSSKVKVTFIDDATGDAFAVSEMPPSDLPDSFELDTTLHLGGEDWTVVDAQPRARAEYAKSKVLKLRLRRLERVDPSTILFSLPSICDAIPGVNDHPNSGDEFVLAEDDWRQFELVSKDLSRDVDDEIEQIRRIHENAAAEVGWREIHVRSKIEFPIACALGLADLVDALACAPIGLTYRGAASQIVDGFAFRADGLTIYGVAPNGNVQTIAFDQYSDVSPTSQTIELTRSLAQNSGLDLVYWCRCVRVSPDDPLFGKLLSEIAT